ncbi:MAG TPA: VOC family protein [Egibacteraceae bacterium]|nr:VOC family protein [Egibacteraceae bacterium]
MTAFPSIGHVALTVSDLPASVAWYGKLFGVEPVLDENVGAFHHTVFPVGGGLIGLHAHPSTAGEDRFDEYRVGLDHVAFGCADRSELEEWAGRLDGLGVAHSGIVDAGYGSGLSFRDPDGIALEFFAPPAG